MRTYLSISITYLEIQRKPRCCSDVALNGRNGVLGHLSRTISFSRPGRVSEAKGEKAPFLTESQPRFVTYSANSIAFSIIIGIIACINVATSRSDLP